MKSPSCKQKERLRHTETDTLKTASPVGTDNMFPSMFLGHVASVETSEKRQHPIQAQSDRNNEDAAVALLDHEQLPKFYRKHATAQSSPPPNTRTTRCLENEHLVEPQPQTAVDTTTTTQETTSDTQAGPHGTSTRMTQAPETTSNTQAGRHGTSKRPTSVHFMK